MESCFLPRWLASRPEDANGQITSGVAPRMSIFQCSECGCGEDTALCRYWSARVRDMVPMCSACDPKIGKWHGHFPREPFVVEREIQRMLEVSWACAPVPRQTTAA